MSDETNKVEELSEVNDQIEPKAETETAEPIKITSKFITVKPSKKKKAEPVIDAPKVDKPKSEVVNNIQLKLKEDVFNKIKPNTTLRANFKNLQVRVQYNVQQEDSPEQALETLRLAIFCLSRSKELPENCSSKSTIGYTSLPATLSRAIAKSGEIDAVIEVV